MTRALSSIPDSAPLEDDETGFTGERESARDLRIYRSRIQRRDATERALVPAIINDGLLNELSDLVSPPASVAPPAGAGGGVTTMDVELADSRLEFALYTLDDLRQTLLRSCLRVDECRTLQGLAETIETQLEAVREHLGTKPITPAERGED